MKNIAVFFGGKSSEHDISVITGVLALNGTDKANYNTFPVYIDKDGLWYGGEELFNVENYKNLDYKKLTRLTVSVGEPRIYELKKGKLKNPVEIALALNCLHGINGEDGSLSGVMRMCGIPLASPDVLGAAISMDKGVCKDIARAHLIRTLKYVEITSDEFFKDSKECRERVEQKIGYPVIIKPSRLGSSIGITCAENGGELNSGLLQAFRYDKSCVIEKKLVGFREFNCACVKTLKGLKVSRVEEAVTINPILTFQDKYGCGTGGCNRREAQGVADSVINEISGYTKLLYKVLKLNGAVRADFLYKDGVVYFNEINTVPGSLAYYLYCDSLNELGDYLNDIYAESLKAGNAEKALTTDFESVVLKLSGIKSGKGKLRR